MAKILGGWVEVPNVTKMNRAFIKAYFKAAKILQIDVVLNLLCLFLIIMWWLKDWDITGYLGIMFVYGIKAILNQAGQAYYIKELEEKLKQK